MSFPRHPRRLSPSLSLEGGYGWGVEPQNPVAFGLVSSGTVSADAFPLADQVPAPRACPPEQARPHPGPR